MNNPTQMVQNVLSQALDVARDLVQDGSLRPSDYALAKAYIQGPRKILSDGATNAKTAKSKPVTGIVYLDSREPTCCPWASKACSDACLFSSGRGAMGSVKEARAYRTARILWLRKFAPAAVVPLLIRDMLPLARRAVREGRTLAMRPNGTSDLPWLRLAVMQAMGRLLQFAEFETLRATARVYDYTKQPIPAGGPADRWHRTFSWAGSRTNASHAAHEPRVAVVLTPAAYDFAKASGMRHARVVSGDGIAVSARQVVWGADSDYRPDDPQRCIVALRASGKALLNTVGNLGFVLDVRPEMYPTKILTLVTRCTTMPEA